MITLTSDKLKELREMADIFKDRLRVFGNLGPIPFQKVEIGQFRGLNIVLREDNSLEVSE